MHFSTISDKWCRKKKALREVDSLNIYVKKRERLKHQPKCPNQELKTLPANSKKLEIKRIRMKKINEVENS